MLAHINGARKACNLEDALDEIILLEDFNILDILKSLSTLIEEVMDIVQDGHDNIDIDSANEHISKFHVDYEQVIATVKAHGVNLFFKFFLIYNSSGTVNFTMYNIFFHNFNGSRRTFKEFRKIISQDLFAIMSRLFSYILLLDFEVPKSANSVLDIINNETLLPGLSIYKMHWNKLFNTDFPGFMTLLIYMHLLIFFLT